MDFIFNINNAAEDTNNNKDLEDVLAQLELHFEDWQNFYNLYKMYAPPPSKNQEQIQTWFKELQAAFIKIVEQYNNKVNKFAEIVETDADTAADLLGKMLSSVKEPVKPKKEKKSNTDSNYMWG
tara:strand:- start:52 stop:423 length:372 start_codon:yes stop_codon:yes gene_type:complete